ncbi:MAG: hypothetical protein BGO98_25320 [Myxococcales bacterium 68-20]|nr:MAG: hypothetical protein BGO98_25320 [Myxococcales bacterium 68-20]
MHVSTVELGAPSIAPEPMSLSESGLYLRGPRPDASEARAATGPGRRRALSDHCLGIGPDDGHELDASIDEGA